MATRYNLEMGTPGQITLRNTIQGAGGIGDGLTVQVWGGWKWLSQGREYKTTREGDGLFARRTDGTWDQLRGTSQFSLPRDRQAALRALRNAGFAPDQIS